MILPKGYVQQKNTYVMGIDAARLGEDSTVFMVIEENWQDQALYVVYIEEMRHKLLTEIAGRAKILDSKFNFKKIMIDDTGLGSGVVDILKESVGTKVEGITFTIGSKEDMYSNLKLLFEKGRLKIPCHKKLLYQLQDLRYEVTPNGGVKIHHSERGFDDFCLIGDTLILTNKGNIPIKKIRVGDEVMTRKGYKKVLAISKRIKPVITNLGLTGTEDHPVITTKGIEKLIDVNESHKIYIWNEKQLSIEERDRGLLRQGFVLQNVKENSGGKKIRKNVYNIKVEDASEYFANGILVHNCDALALAAYYFKVKPKHTFYIG